MHTSLPVRRFAHLALLLVALAATWVAIGAPAMQRAGAQEGSGTSATGFIVDTGEGEPVYVVVTFDEPSVTAVELLRLAGLDAVTVEFGGLGEAVCSIVDTGCDVSTCRQRVCQTGDPESPFWQYWEQDDEGNWALSPLGASHAEIEHGTIAAWVWTGVEPELEPLEWSELAERAGAPDDVIQGDVTSGPAVHVTMALDDGDEAVERAGTLVAVGVVGLVAIAGGWLVVRNRRTSGTLE